MNIPICDLEGLAENQVPDIQFLKHLGPYGMPRLRSGSLVLLQLKRTLISHTNASFLSHQVIRLSLKQLVAKISGREMRLAEFEPLQGLFEIGNRGRHKLYAGKKGYGSQINVPLVDLNRSCVPRTRKI